MTTYIVTFDIADATRKKNLEAKLRQFDSYCPIHGSCWAVVSNQTAAEVRSALAEVLNASDRIFVIRSGVAAAWRNIYGEKNSKWLKDKL